MEHSSYQVLDQHEQGENTIATDEAVTVRLFRVAIENTSGSTNHFVYAARNTRDLLFSLVKEKMTVKTCSPLSPPQITSFTEGQIDDAKRAITDAESMNTLAELAFHCDAEQLQAV